MGSGSTQRDELFNVMESPVKLKLKVSERGRGSPKGSRNKRKIEVRKGVQLKGGDRKQFTAAEALHMGK